MFEYIYTDSKDLDYQLKILNRVLIRLDRHARGNDKNKLPMEIVNFITLVDKNKFELESLSLGLTNLGQQLRNLANKNKNTDAIKEAMLPFQQKYNQLQKPILDAFLNLYNDNSDLDNCTSGRSIFAGIDANSFLQPLIGEKTKNNLYNKDLVIGAKCRINDLYIEYRVDYDPEKKLHINLNINKGINKKQMLFELAYALPLCLDPESKYYSICMSPDGDEDLQMQLIKYKYELKMSHDYYLHVRKNLIPNNPASEYKSNVVTGANGDHQSVVGAMRENIVKFFLGEELDLASFIPTLEKHTDQHPDQKFIMVCESVDKLHNLFDTNMYVRDTLLNAGIEHYSSQNTSGINLPLLARDEKQSDSEPEEDLTLSEGKPKARGRSRKAKDEAEIKFEKKRRHTTGEPTTSTSLGKRKNWDNKSEEKKGPTNRIIYSVKKSSSNTASALRELSQFRPAKEEKTPDQSHANNVTKKFKSNKS